MSLENKVSKEYQVAVVGATGAVGQAMLSILAERQFPVGKVFALGSERSAGQHVSFGSVELVIEDLANFDFSQAHIALFSAGGSISEKYAPIAAKAGCVVIDNSSYFRMDPDVPLIVPEVNPEAISAYKKKNIIANPNCSTIQMVVAMAPIYQRYGITRVNAATYQSVSGSGRQGIEELEQQTLALLQGKAPEMAVYNHPIAFNVLPEIDVLENNGYTKEEMKMVNETRKIFNDNNISVNPTAVRVPVFYGHSEALHIETKDAFEFKELMALLRIAPGVVLMEAGYPTAMEEGSGSDAVYIGRVRRDISHKKGINLWVVADNLRKGAALNAVQIAELLITQKGKLPLELPSNKDKIH